MQSEIDKAVADALEDAINESNTELLDKISDMEEIIEGLKNENAEQDEKNKRQARRTRLKNSIGYFFCSLFFCI